MEKRGGQTRGRGKRGRGSGIKTRGTPHKYIRYCRKTFTPALKLSAAAAARFEKLTTAPKVEPRKAVHQRKQPMPLQNALHETQAVSPEGWTKKELGSGFYFESDEDVLLPVSYWSLGVFPNNFTIISGVFVERSVPQHILSILTMFAEEDLPFIACFVEISTTQLIRDTPTTATPAPNTATPRRIPPRRGPPRQAKQAAIEVIKLPDNQITEIKIIINKPGEDKEYRPGDRI